MNPENSLITTTFGECGIYYKGMKMIGKIADEGQGFTRQQLKAIKRHVNSLGADARMYTLGTNTLGTDTLGTNTLNVSTFNLPDACVLVIKNGVDFLLRESSYTKEGMFIEQAAINFDKKAFMYGKVVNKIARYNVCLDDISSEPDYPNKKGRVVSYSELPITKYIREQFEKYFGKKSMNLKAELNCYYDVKKCGIGFHGDSERRKVIAIRLGASMPLYFAWYHEGERISDLLQINLDNGDIYIMSEKSVGTDWKKKNVYTLRHATGFSDKFIF